MNRGSRIKKGRILLLVLVFSFFIFHFSFSNSAQAAIVHCGRLSDDPETKTIDESKPCTTCDILIVGKNLIDFALFKAAPAVGTLLFLLAGFLILLGGAAPSKFSAGKEIFRNTALGLVIMFSAWLVANTTLRSLAGDEKVASQWYKLECQKVVQPQPQPQPQPEPQPGGGTCTGAVCQDSSVNVCGPVNPGDGCDFQAVDALKVDIIIGAGNKTICSGVDTTRLLESIIANESDGRVDIGSADGLSAGPFQLTTETASRFKTACGMVASEVIDQNWLRRRSTVSTQACIAAEFIKTLVGPCGCEVRQLAAGYNGGGKGKGACEVSTNCGPAARAEGGECSVCAGQSRSTKRWECQWDDNQHKVCNASRQEGSFAPTRRYAPRVEYCYQNVFR